jgi:hypothetical protein
VERAERPMRCDPTALEGSDSGDGMDAADEERWMLDMRLVLPTAGGQHRHLKRSMTMWMRVSLVVKSEKPPCGERFFWIV